MLVHDARKPLPPPSSPMVASKRDRARFARNMAAIKRHIPQLHARLAEIRRPHSTLVATADGGFDVEFGGRYLYGRSARAHAKDHVRDFFLKDQGQTRLAVATMDTRNLDSVANKSIYDMMRKAVTDRRIKFSVETPINHCYHLVVFGIGLAEHLPPLVKRTNCQQLILIEPNLEFIYHSLFTFDWDDFLTRFLRDGRNIAFVDSARQYETSLVIRTQIRGYGLIFTEGTFIYFAYPNSVFEAAGAELSKDRDLILMGLGFLEDEIDMVRNTQKNLVDFSGRYFQQHATRCPIPAFVVAAGPSLDNDLEFIRSHVERAIVISCGTTLRILLRNGIRPDFHVEMENVPAVADLMKKLSADYSFDDMTLIASSTVDPGVRSFFKNIVFYFRPGLASFPMFAVDDKSALTMGLPTVANLGLAFAQEIGCSAIYLFGMDLGTRDQRKHHAKDAAYNVGEIEFNTTIDQPVPGNFGGTVYSERIYLWSRDMAQHSVKSGVPRIVHYNCSDGVRIDGAIPKLSRTIDLTPQKDKRSAIAGILSSYPQYTRDHFDRAWTDRNVVRDVLAYRNRLSMHLRAPQARGKSRFKLKFMADIFRDLVPVNNKTTSEIHFYRGTLFQALIAMYYYEGRVIGRKQYGIFMRLMTAALQKLINDIAEQILSFYRTLDPEKIARNEKSAKDLLVPAPKSKPRARAKGRKRARATRIAAPRRRQKKRGAKRGSRPRRLTNRPVRGRPSRRIRR